MGVMHEFIRDKFQQFLLDFQYVLAGGNACPVGDPENMGIDSNGRLAKRSIEDDIGRLSTDSSQGLKIGTIIRDFAIMLVQQQLAGVDDIAGFGVIQANGLYVLAQSSHSKVQNRLRRVGNLIQFPGGLVDTDIGGLGREDYSDEQFKRGLVFQFSGGFRIGSLEPGKYFVSFLIIHEYKSIFN